MSTNRPIPLPTPETAPFWAATVEGRLSVQCCRACGTHIFYPRLVCPSCMSDELDWITCTGRGLVYSFTIVRRAPPAFADRVPYVVALIELEEGPRMMSWVRTPDVDGVRIGMPVVVDFEAVSEDVALPVFVPAEGSRP